MKDINISIGEIKGVDSIPVVSFSIGVLSALRLHKTLERAKSFKELLECFFSLNTDDREREQMIIIALGSVDLGDSYSKILKFAYLDCKDSPNHGLFLSNKQLKLSGDVYIAAIAKVIVKTLNQLHIKQVFF